MAEAIHILDRMRGGEIRFLPPFGLPHFPFARLFSFFQKDKIYKGLYAPKAMNPKNRGPPERPVTPTSAPERNLQEEWLSLYRELMKTGDRTQDEVLEEISRHYYGTSKTTIYRTVFPQQKLKMKKMPSQSWQYQISRPQFSREVYNMRRRNYAYARYHLEDLTLDAYLRAAPQEELSLHDLSLFICESADVSFRPSTLLHLLARSSPRTSHPVLQHVPGTENPSLYRLTAHYRQSLQEKSGHA